MASDENRRLAEDIHRAFYDAQVEIGPYRDYISFEGHPESYQKMLFRVIEILKERGIIDGCI